MAATEVRLESTLSPGELGRCFESTARSRHSVGGRIGAAVRGGGSGFELFEPDRDVFDALDDDPEDFAVGVFIPTLTGTSGGTVAVHMYVWDRADHREVRLVSPHGRISGATKSRRALEHFVEAITARDPGARPALTGTDEVLEDEPWGEIVRRPDADDGSAREASEGDAITLDFGDGLVIQLTVHELRAPLPNPDPDAPTPDEGTLLCGVRVSIENCGVDTLANPFGWAEIGTATDLWVGANDFGVNEIEPGVAYDGWLIFELPETERPAVFRYTEVFGGATGEWRLDYDEPAPLPGADPRSFAAAEVEEPAPNGGESATLDAPSNDPAVAILRERYARGELSRDEFREMLADLRDS